MNKKYHSIDEINYIISRRPWGFDNMRKILFDEGYDSSEVNLILENIIGPKGTAIKAINPDNFIHDLLNCYKYSEEDDKISKMKKQQPRTNRGALNACKTLTQVVKSNTNKIASTLSELLDRFLKSDKNMANSEKIYHLNDMIETANNIQDLAKCLSETLDKFIQLDMSIDKDEVYANQDVVANVGNTGVIAQALIKKVLAQKNKEITAKKKRSINPINWIKDLLWRFFESTGQAGCPYFKKK